MADHENHEDSHDGSEDSILKDAKEAFTLAEDFESDNRELAREDLRFARLGDQWDDTVLQQRKTQGRPALTIPKLATYIRQVTNDARANKPQIKVRPVDSGADVATAKVINGLIRNIEQTSNADVAYDTAADFAVSMGFGYFRVDVDYAEDDTFEQDILIERIPNPFNVFGDPYSEAADSSDWNTAFLVKMLSKDRFEREHKGAEPVDWEQGAYSNLDQAWFDGDNVMIAEHWIREEIKRTVFLLSNGEIVGADVYEANRDTFEVLGITVQTQRQVKSHKITHHLLTGAEVLETTEWPGRYIPIIPVYGEEVNVDGKRHFRSLIRDAKDAQRMFNYWRTYATELVGMAPKAPYIGPEKAFTGKDARKWETANTENWSFIAYAGKEAPERQPFAGVPAGALQEALNASDDMKAIMGLHEASIDDIADRRSGKAIRALQGQANVATFHFLDNLSRGIRHGGRVVLDLIPFVYSGERIIRTLGQDGTVESAQLGQEAVQEDLKEGIAGVYNLTAGNNSLSRSAISSAPGQSRFLGSRSPITGAAAGKAFSKSIICSAAS